MIAIIVLVGVLAGLVVGVAALVVGSRHDDDQQYSIVAAPAPTGIPREITGSLLEVKLPSPPVGTPAPVAPQALVAPQLDVETLTAEHGCGPIAMKVEPVA